ncbi:MAG TPA: GGDEF domain-containing protein [Burkholderiaceae bacterium]|nr:GGDEF domain-containing protein [Burkholderiaceae bacterium]
MSVPIQLLCQGGSPPDLATSALGPFIVHGCASLDEAAARLDAGRYDALLLHAATPAELRTLEGWGVLSRAALDVALVVVTPEPTADDLTRMLLLGVQEVVPARDEPDRLALALRQGVERKRFEGETRHAYATDLGTGLPNQAQLMEHMTHLLALRERDRASMAVLELRVEGLAAAQARLGPEAANVARRKIAVRLRSGLRASDVVASIGADRFAVLLAWIDDPADGERVAAKLVSKLQRPLGVAGQEIEVAVDIGVARYPDDGRDANALLSLAASQAALNRPRAQGRVERAANDEQPPRS